MKPVVAVVAGGDSGEYAISIKSAEIVIQNIDSHKYVIYPIHLKGAEWTFTDPKSGQVYSVDKNDFSLSIDHAHITFDCVFNVIHGTPGEDGKLQGYFDMLKIPYTSCGSITSALTFNKSFCNRVVASFGVTTSKSVHLFRKDAINIDAICQALRFPMFIKPNCGGSSVGMSKVYEKAELMPAIQKAYAVDEEILIEEFVAGREITCGVLKIGERIKALPLTEVVPKNDYFDFSAKYDDGRSDEIVPAPIPENRAKECASLSEMLYSKLNCKGVVRFDYIMTETSFNFLEVNTVPGLSAASIVPKMAKAAGYSLSEFYDFLIAEALQKD
jgi:D-alanine-D-alanine ligase